MTLLKKITLYTILFFAALFFVYPLDQSRAAEPSFANTSFTESIEDESFFTDPLSSVQVSLDEEQAAFSQFPELYKEGEVDPMSTPIFIGQEPEVDVLPENFNPQFVLNEPCTNVSGLKDAEDVNLDLAPGNDFASQAEDNASYSQGFSEALVEDYYAEERSLKQEIAECLVRQRQALSVEAGDYVSDAVFLAQEQAKEDLILSERLISEESEAALAVVEEEEQSLENVLQESYEDILQKTKTELAERKASQAEVDQALATLEKQYRAKASQINSFVNSKRNALKELQGDLEQRAENMYQETLDSTDYLRDYLKAEAAVLLEAEVVESATQELRSLDIYKEAWEEELGQELPDSALVEGAGEEIVLEAESAEAAENGDQVVDYSASVGRFQLDEVSEMELILEQDGIYKGEIYELDEVSDRSFSAAEEESLSDATMAQKIAAVYLTSLALEGYAPDQLDDVVQDRFLSDAWNKVKSGAKAVGGAVKSAGKKVVDTIKKAPAAVVKAVNSGAKAVARTVRGAGKAVGKAVSSAGRMVAGVTSSAASGVSGWVASATASPSGPTRQEIKRERAQARKKVKQAVRNMSNEEFKKFLAEAPFGKAFVEKVRLKRKVYNLRSITRTADETVREINKANRELASTQSSLDKVNNSYNREVAGIRNLKAKLEKNPNDAQLKLQLRQAERDAERIRQSRDNLMQRSNGLSKKLSKLNTKQLRQIDKIEKEGRELAKTRGRIKQLVRSGRLPGGIRQSLTRISSRALGQFSAWQKAHKSQRAFAREVVLNMNGVARDSKGRVFKGEIDLGTDRDFALRERDKEGFMSWSPSYYDIGEMQQAAKRKGFNCGPGFQFCHFNTRTGKMSQIGKGVPRSITSTFAAATEKMDAAAVWAAQKTTGCKECPAAPWVAMGLTMWNPAGWGKAGTQLSVKALAKSALKAGAKSPAAAKAMAKKFLSQSKNYGASIIRPFSSFGKKPKPTKPPKTDASPSPVTTRPAPSSGPRPAPSPGPRPAPSSGPRPAPSSGPRPAPSSGPRPAPSSGGSGISQVWNSGKEKIMRIVRKPKAAPVREKIVLTADDLARNGAGKIIITADDLARAGANKIVISSDDLAGRAGKKIVLSADDLAKSGRDKIVITADDLARNGNSKITLTADDLASEAGERIVLTADDLAREGGERIVLTADDLARNGDSLASAIAGAGARNGFMQSVRNGMSRLRGLFGGGSSKKIVVTADDLGESLARGGGRLRITADDLAEEVVVRSGGGKIVIRAEDLKDMPGKLVLTSDDLARAAKEKIVLTADDLGAELSESALKSYVDDLARTSDDLLTRSTYAPTSKTSAELADELSRMGIYGRSSYRTAASREALLNHHAGEAIRTSLTQVLGRTPNKDDLLRLAGSGSKGSPGMGLAVKSSDTVEQLLLQIGNASRNPALLNNASRRALLKAMGSKGYSAWSKRIMNSQITNNLNRLGREHAAAIGSQIKKAQAAARANQPRAYGAGAKARLDSLQAQASSAVRTPRGTPPGTNAPRTSVLDNAGREIGYIDDAGVLIPVARGNGRVFSPNGRAVPNGQGVARGQELVPAPRAGLPEPILNVARPIPRYLPATITKNRDLLPYLAALGVTGSTLGMLAVAAIDDNGKEKPLPADSGKECRGPKCGNLKNNKKEGKNPKGAGPAAPPAAPPAGPAAGGAAGGSGGAAASTGSGSGGGSGSKPAGAIQDGATTTPDAEEILEAPGTVAQTPEEVANPFADEAGPSGDNPSAAALKIGNELCSAVVVDPEWLLTAAHCVYSDTTNKVLHPTDAIQAVIGQKNISSPVYASVSEIIPHPGYTAREKEYDVALLRLSEKTDAPPMPIADIASADSWAAGSKASVAGWGLACKGCAPSSTISVREVAIADQEVCATAYKGSKPAMNITANMICAQSPVREACTGDSGGPLSVKVGGRDELVGLVSFGVGCNNPKYPGVYTYLPAVAPWIGGEIVQDLSIEQKLVIVKKAKRVKKDKALNLENNSAFPVPLKGIILKGSKRFSLAPGSCGDVLAAGESCAVRIVFKGKGQKQAQGQLLVVGTKGNLAESELLGKKAKKTKQAKKATKTKKKA